MSHTTGFIWVYKSKRSSAVSMLDKEFRRGIQTSRHSSQNYEAPSHNGQPDWADER